MNASDDWICIQPSPLVSSSPITTRVSDKHFKSSKPKNHKLSWDLGSSPRLYSSLLFSSSPSFPCSLPFFSCHWQSNWNCSVPHYLYQSVIRFPPFCLFTVFDAHSSAPFFTAALSQASYHFLPCQWQSLLIRLSSLNFNSLKTKYITVFKAL